MRTIKYPVDALYPSPYDWVACDYLLDKVKKGIWKNIFSDDNQIKIVPASEMTFGEYQKAWLNLYGEYRGLDDRWIAMTKCPLLKTMYGMCELDPSMRSQQ